MVVKPHGLQQITQVAVGAEVDSHGAGLKSPKREQSKMKGTWGSAWMLMLYVALAVALGTTYRLMGMHEEMTLKAGSVWVLLTGWDPAIQGNIRCVKHKQITCQPRPAAELCELAGHPEAAAPPRLSRLFQHGPLVGKRPVFGSP